MRYTNRLCGAAGSDCRNDLQLHLAAAAGGAAQTPPVLRAAPLRCRSERGGPAPVWAARHQSLRDVRAAGCGPPHSRRRGCGRQDAPCQRAAAAARAMRADHHLRHGGLPSRHDAAPQLVRAALPASHSLAALGLVALPFDSCRRITWHCLVRVVTRNILFLVQTWWTICQKRATSGAELLRLARASWQSAVTCHGWPGLQQGPGVWPASTSTAELPQ